MISRRQLLLGLNTLGLSLFAGCTTVSPPDFSTSGRFSVIVENSNKHREHISGKFSYSRKGSLLRLDLLTPLNGILARIEVSPEKACIKTHSSEKEICEPDSDTLFIKTLGFPIPVSVIEEWSTSTDTPNGYGWKLRILKREGGYPKTIKALRHFPLNTITLTLVFDSVS